MSDISSVEPTLDEKILRQWIGRDITVTDTIRPHPVAFMHATLDRAGDPPRDGDPLPPAWHWLYFLEVSPLRDAGRDGHPKRGSFLPPVALPRRMWAGGRLQFFDPVRIGDEIEKHSTVTDVTRKSGRSGELCFVTVQHRFLQGDVLKMSEEHDIVYREDPDPDAAAPSPPDVPADAMTDITTDGQHSIEIAPGPVLLFRYSALTFNSHRIHYDLDYCRNVEGLPGLIVHGPLTATLLMAMAAERCKGGLGAFDFRAVSPLYDTHPFTLHCRENEDSLDLWAVNHEGKLAMSATATPRR